MGEGGSYRAAPSAGNRSPRPQRRRAHALVPARRAWPCSCCACQADDDPPPVLPRRRDVSLAERGGSRSPIVLDSDSDGEGGGSPQPPADDDGPDAGDGDRRLETTQDGAHSGHSSPRAQQPGARHASRSLTPEMQPVWGEGSVREGSVGSRSSRESIARCTPPTAAMGSRAPKQSRSPSALGICDAGSFRDTPRYFGDILPTPPHADASVSMAESGATLEGPVSPGRR